MKRPGPVDVATAWAAAKACTVLRDLQVDRLRATATRVRLLLKGDAAAFHQRRNAGALHGRDMDENVLAA